MGNKYYSDGAFRAPKVHALFSSIAARYDRVNDLQSFGLHRAWKRRMKQWARPAPGVRALDLCCGTGDVALAMARSGAGAVGVDFAKPMLKQARRRAIRLGLQREYDASATRPVDRRPHESAVRASESSDGCGAAGTIAFVQGDALRIPFGSARFDVVTMSYGLRNLADFRAGLVEIFRVLAPGGRLVILDFGKPSNRVWRSMYFAYLRFFVPVFGRVFCGDADAYGYILESLRHYPAQSGIHAMLNEVGFKRLKTADILGGVMSLSYGEKPTKR